MGSSMASILHLFPSLNFSDTLLIQLLAASRQTFAFSRDSGEIIYAFPTSKLMRQSQRFLFLDGYTE
jgi:hypothetical protein